MPLTYCPNCRHPLEEGTLGWVCWRPVSKDTFQQDGGAAAGDEADAVFGERTPGDDADAAYFFEEDVLCKTFNGPNESVCTNPRCKGSRAPDTLLPACPRCRGELPQIDSLDARTLTVTGPRGSGKTHYIVALHDWWRKNLSAFGLTCMSAMNRGVESVFNRMRDGIIRRQIALQATPAGKQISFSWQICPPAHAAANGILVSLPDVSGERLELAEYLAANRYYHYTSGVIFLLDGDRISPPEDEEDAGGEAAFRDFDDHFRVATAMIDDLRRRLPQVQVTELPVAICVNKIDKLRKVDSRWADLTAEYIPNHDRAFDFQTCAARSQAIYALLAENPETSATVGLLVNNFPNAMFFTVATIGSDTRPVRWRPQSVEDPFLYLMWHMGYVA